MNRKGAQMIIENLSLRIFEIQDICGRLKEEETRHRARILELEKVRDNPEEVVE
jgi:hypothetical protein